MDAVPVDVFDLVTVPVGLPLAVGLEPVDGVTLPENEQDAEGDGDDDGDGIS
jgi:hypothetical protein